MIRAEDVFELGAELSFQHTFDIKKPLLVMNLFKNNTKILGLQWNEAENIHKYSVERVWRGTNEKRVFHYFLLFAEEKGKKFITRWKQNTSKQEELEMASNGSKNSHCYALEQKIATWNQDSKLKVEEKRFFEWLRKLLMLKILFSGSNLELFPMRVELVFNRLWTEFEWYWELWCYG